MNNINITFNGAVQTLHLSTVPAGAAAPPPRAIRRVSERPQKNLANLTKDIYDNLDNHNKTIGIFLDLSKAFDSIPHQKLLKCIKSFGIIRSAYSIFKSYLEGRTQQVKVNDKLSDIGIIHRGVPQGTVLSPILYIMYVSALDGLSLNGKIYSYADDTAIIVSSSNWESTWQKSESNIAVLDTFSFLIMILK